MSRYSRVRQRPDRMVQIGSWGTAFVFGLVFLVGIGLYEHASKMTRFITEVRTTVAEIGDLHSDARATMAAVIGGNATLLDRHGRMLEQFQTALEDLDGRPGTEFLQGQLEDMRRAHEQMRAMERLLLARAESGMRPQALESLVGEEYLSLDSAFTAAQRSAVRAMARFAQDQRRQVLEDLRSAGLLLLLCVGILLLLKNFTIRTVRGYMLERERSDAELRRAQAKAEQARKEAQAANRAKSEFLWRMSHELRTPLNSILGFGQLLEAEIEREGDREAVKHILHAGEHLLNLIGEILDLATIEAGELKLSTEDVELNDAVRSAIRLVAPMAAKRDIVPQMEGSLGAGVTVRCDTRRLTQVLLNLLSNAVKYNREAGSISVSTEQMGDDRIRISVRDTGMGIPEEQVERLFTPFHRAGAERHGIEGTGLGLSLSRGLVEAMGGTLSVSSVEGEGSTFSVVLPRGSDLRVEFLRDTEWLTEEATVGAP